MIITLSGTPGSGKSTVAEILAQKLKAGRIAVGQVRRELAKQKKMTLPELNEYAKTHPETDVDVDKEAAREARVLEKKKKIVIVEGRVQYHFLPESLKIYLKVDPEVGAKRIWKDLRDAEKKKKRNEGHFPTFAELKREIIRRPQEDAQRYKKYYGIDHRNESQYDLVIDTTKLNPAEVVEKILSYLLQRTKNLIYYPK